MKKLAIAGACVALLIVVAVVAAIVLAPRLREAGQEVVRMAPAVMSRTPATGMTSTMRMPRPKKCLQAPSIDLDGEEMEAIRIGEGLDAQQISGAFGPYNSFLASCQPVDGEDHSGTVVFEIHVGCDGVVKGVELTDDELYEPAMIECLQDRLRYVEFPAHDLEDGMYFEFPLIFHPPQP